MNYNFNNSKILIIGQGTIGAKAIKHAFLPMSDHARHIVTDASPTIHAISARSFLPTPHQLQSYSHVIYAGGATPSMHPWTTRSQYVFYHFTRPYSLLMGLLREAVDVHFSYLSTSGVYSRDNEPPVSEEGLVAPSNAYVAAKLKFESTVYNHGYEDQCLILRVPSFVDDGSGPNSLNAKARNYSLVEDVAVTCCGLGDIIAAACAGITGIRNVGSYTTTVEKICRAVGNTDYEVVSSGSLNKTPIVPIDYSKLQNELKEFIDA